MDENPHVGLIFLIPGVNDTVRVNGTVTIVNQAELNQKDVEVALYEPDERGYHLQGIIIEVDEAYGHCPPRPELFPLLGCRDHREAQGQPAHSHPLRLF